MARYDPSRMSRNVTFMAEWLRQEQQFFKSILMSDERAAEIRAREREWPLQYVKRENGAND